MPSYDTTKNDRRDCGHGSGYRTLLETVDFASDIGQCYVDQRVTHVRSLNETHAGRYDVYGSVDISAIDGTLGVQSE